MTRLQRDFEQFDQDNPRIYELLCKFIDQAIARGFRRLGMQMLYERVRWEVMIETTDTEFKLNNNHVAYYARKWLREHPQYPDFFATRRVKGDSDWLFGSDGQGQLI